MKFIRHLIDVTSIMQLSKSQRRIVFYSEGKEYWVHLEGLLKEFLNLSNVPACYISSGEDDPGLFYKHPNLKSFKIDEGGYRDWLFKNIDTDVMIMTMPDLGQYQVKRSKKPVHYVYVQHSLVSLHMVYRKGAFDKYDTIFCAGPHQIREVRAIEKKYNLPPKKLVEHGYGRIDSIIDSIEKSTEKTTNDPPKILIAPSWGENALIESIGEKVVLHLLETGFHVTLRPHPRTVKFSKDKLNSISQQHKHNPNFSYEINIASQKSLHQSDLMISDWSGAALDYAFGLGKPVLFIDVPRKINNQEYESINIDPFEVWIRNKIGRVQRLEDLESLNRSVYDLLSSKTCFDQKSLAEKNIFNLGNSSRIGAAHLMKII
jgi:CDP-glycerol glycerophosphotransferase (TagB/SpsB family)